MFSTRFENIINSHHTVLFMKGTLSFPLCGLSSRICFLLKKHSYDFKTEDLLQEPELYFFLRETHSPASAPYLYINGKFIGGYDEILTIFNEKNFISLPRETSSQDKNSFEIFSVPMREHF